MAATRKAPSGLTRCVLLRVDDMLMDGLTALAAEERIKRHSAEFSRADLIREILWAGLLSIDPDDPEVPAVLLEDGGDE